MSGSTPEQSGTPAEEVHVPSLRERLRPLELLGISLVLGLFAGLVTGLTSRDWLLAVIMLGVAFVVALVVLAMLALGGYEPPAAPSAKGVLGERDERRQRGDTPH